MTTEFLEHLNDLKAYEKVARTLRHPDGYATTYGSTWVREVLPTEPNNPLPASNPELGESDPVRLEIKPITLESMKKDSEFLIRVVRQTGNVEDRKLTPEEAWNFSRAVNTYEPEEEL